MYVLRTFLSDWALQRGARIVALNQILALILCGRHVNFFLNILLCSFKTNKQFDLNIRAV